MPEPGIFSLDDDIRSMILRLNASLERFDLGMEKVVRFLDTAERAAARLDQILAAVQGEAKK